MKKDIYLDYSATTMPDEVVIEEFVNVAKSNYANPNSNHKMGKSANDVILDSTMAIANYFSVRMDEVIFTSGASESNNMVFKGLSEVSDKKHIITTPLEHSSIYGPIGYLQKHGYSVDIVKLKSDGCVDVDDLVSLIRDDTLLVSVCAVDSEVGTRQPIEYIGEVLKSYDVYFHVDMTQAVGKVAVFLEDVDFASFSGHKIYSFKGIGGLIKKSNIKLSPLIHGGKSTTAFRSGTPQTELIASLGKAFTLFSDSLDSKYDYVKSINDEVKEHLSKYDDVVINSTSRAIPHILNVSFLGREANEVQKFFEENNIYISTKTACASSGDMSKSVYAIYEDEARAKSSVRISFSYKTTREEVECLKKVIDMYEVYNENN